MHQLKYFLNLFTFFAPLLAVAQEGILIKGQLVDIDQQAIAYVNIGILETSTGTVSAPDGTFELYIKEGTDEEQIVRFSHIGYEPKDYTIASLRLLNGAVIQLTASSISLATIEVLPTFTKTKWMGHKRTSPQRVTNFAITKKPNQNLGAAIGRKFNLGKELSHLKQFRFFVAYSDFDTIRFHLHIHTLTNGRPGQALHNQPILIEITKQQKGWTSIDLSPYQLYTKGAIAATISWIYHSEKGKYLQLPLTMPALGTHFYRYGSQSKWKRFRGMSTAMELEVAQ